jgi:hypothetical protein
MTELFIGRLTATATAVAEHDADAASGRPPRENNDWLRNMLEHLAQHRLDDALAAADLPDGEWCFQRLDILLPVNLRRPESALETQWARAIIQEIRQRMAAGPSEDILHFPRPTDALKDLVVSLAAGRLDHSWAWRQLGLLMPEDPDPAEAMAPALLAVLRRRPEYAFASVVAAVDLLGLAPLHRLLAGRGWQELAAVVTDAVGAPALSYDASQGSSGGSGIAGPYWSAHVAGPGASGDTGNLLSARVAGDQATPADPGQSQLARATRFGQSRDGQLADILRRSGLATAFVRSGFRPDGPSAMAWALLAAAEADPGLLHRPDATAVLESLALRFATGPAGQQGLETAASSLSGSSDDFDPGSRSPADVDLDNRTSRTAPLNQPPPSIDEERRQNPAAKETSASPKRAMAALEPIVTPAGAPTSWAGLPFLLSTAADTGIPEDLIAEPALAARPLRWVVHQLGMLLIPAAPDDPALLALAGLAPTAEFPEGDKPTSIEQAALGNHASHWAGATAVRIGRPHHEPFDVVAEIAFRRGEVIAETGWIEVHLDLSDVDVDLRRAGLDIDPGWVPWLGVVVRYVYA